MSNQLTANGYTQFIDGIIIQWGITPQVTGGTQTTINFPKQIRDAVFMAIATVSGVGIYATGPTNLTTTSFNIYPEATVLYNWIALGY